MWAAGLMGVSMLGAAAGAQGHSRVRVELVGDSTMTDKAGYGLGFCGSFRPSEVECLNHSKGGASTRTYRADGLWASALAVRPDVMLIQLGHNDVTGNPPLPRNTTIEEYEANLRRFVDEAQAQKIEVVLVTPLARRYFQPDGSIHDDLDAHAAVVEKIARERKLPVIDLHEQSRALLVKTGPEAQRMWGASKIVDGNIAPDKTHLNLAGSAVIGHLVAEDLAKVDPRFAPALLASPLMPATLPIERAKKFVLVGDSTVAPQGGWGPGFCAVVARGVDCVDLALNGRSSKSFIDEGAWSKALAEKGNVYLIQFGHNDEKPDPSRHTDPDTTFAANLRRFVHEVEAQGGAVVLLSPLARRTFKDGKPANPSLRAYGDAARRVAAEERVQYIDLLSLSEALLARGTQADADAFDAQAHADAKAENGDKPQPALDRTHLNRHGQEVFGAMVARALVDAQPQLAASFALPASGQVAAR